MLYMRKRQPREGKRGGLELGIREPMGWEEGEALETKI